MNNLDVFLIVIVPVSLCVLAVAFSLLAIISSFIIQNRWYKIDKECDETDELTYNIKEIINNSINISDRYLDNLVNIVRGLDITSNNVMEKGHVYN